MTFSWKHIPGHNKLLDLRVHIIKKEKLTLRKGKWAYRLQALRPVGRNDSAFFTTKIESLGNGRKSFTPFADHLGEKDIHFREV